MKTYDERKAELQATVRDTFRRVDVTRVLQTGSRLAIMGHLRGKPKTLANFCCQLIAVHATPGELASWVEEVRREPLELGN